MNSLSISKVKNILVNQVKTNWKIKILLLIVVFFFIILDLSSKLAAKDFLGGGITLEQTTNLFFSYKTNSGLSFGILSSNIEGAIAVQVFVALLAISSFVLNDRLEYLMSFAWILAGGLGNLIDRIDDGSVIDFISFDRRIFFNLADTYIIIGIVFILYALFLTDDSDLKSVKKIRLRRRKK